MDILCDYAKSEIIIQKSRFLNESFIVTTQSEARKKIKAQKEKYFTANHVTHAFCIGLQGEVFGCSDDGEPQGTAGRPMLEVLKGKKITNILITSTRYFGGILLGTGGLVKAYTNSAKSILSACKVTPYIEKQQLSFIIDYSYYEVIKRLAASFYAKILAENFLERISIQVSLPLEQYQSFCMALKEATNATVQFFEV
ncbi:MAG: IMPACT family protein [Treponemataceae bacterium]